LKKPVRLFALMDVSIVDQNRLGSLGTVLALNASQIPQFVQLSAQPVTQRTLVTQLFQQFLGTLENRFISVRGTEKISKTFFNSGLSQHGRLLV
jgi:hypothetical protein